MEEVWKKLDIDPRYSVSSFGRVKGRRGFLSPSFSHRGLSVCIGRKVETVHRLVARTFLPNLENKPYVSHIDEDPKNNRVDNLKWTSPNERVRKPYSREASLRKIGQYTKEGIFVRAWSSQKEAGENVIGASSKNINQCLKGSKKTHMGFIWKYLDENDLPEEIWKTVIYEKGNKKREITVSSLGRIICKNGKRTFGSLDARGYMMVYFTKGHLEQVHRLVAFAFCEGRTKERNVVNHKDGNKTNNHFSNLEWCTTLENNMHAIESGLRAIKV